MQLELKVLADGGYSNAEAVAHCERDNIEVAVPIKRGAMSTDFFRPTQFTYDESSDTIRCPAGEEPMHTRRPTDHPSAVRPGGAGSYGGQDLRRSQLDGEPPMQPASRGPETGIIACRARNTG